LFSHALAGLALRRNVLGRRYARQSGSPPGAGRWRAAPTGEPFEHEHEHEAERQTPNAKRPLPQLLDHLKHAFGDFANLARCQERQMEQLQQQQALSGQEQDRRILHTQGQIRAQRLEIVFE
jgi:hypothetical protein